MVGADVGGIGESNVEVLFQRRHGGDGDDAGLVGIGLGAAAEAKHDKGRDRKENNYPERHDRMLFQGIHRKRLPGILISPVRKRST